MFVTLSAATPPNARRRKRNVPAVMTERVALPGAVSFYRMTAQVVNGEIPWRIVSEAAGKLRTCMLLPKGGLPGAASGVRLFLPKTLPSVLLLNTAVDVLQKKQLPAPKTPITVVDEAAVLTERIDLLAPFAGALRVLTAKPERYVPAQRRLMEQFGLSLCVCAQNAPLPESGVLLMKTADRAPRLFRGLIFTFDRRRFLFAETSAAADVVLPPKFEALRPPGIDRMQFAAALFERCGVKELENMRLVL